MNIKETALILFALIGSVVGQEIVQGERVILERRILESAVPVDTNNLRRRLESVIPLNNFFSSQFVGTVGIGTPPQHFEVVFDTGSADVWVPLDTCKTCGTHTLFNPSKSSSYKPSGHDLTVSYLGGSPISVKGAYERVSIGQYHFPSLHIGLSIDEGLSFNKLISDGIVGLGFSALSKITKPTLVEQLEFDFFTVFINLNPEVKQVGGYLRQAQSHITFNGYDLSIVGKNAKWNYVPLESTLSDLTDSTAPGKFSQKYVLHDYLFICEKCFYIQVSGK